jgi:plastocyanin domain-containing protein
MRYLKFSIIIMAVLLIYFTDSSGIELKEFTASIGKDGLQRVDMLAGSYFFNPNYIIVKVNVPVEMKIRKESGITPHNFVLMYPDSGMNIHADLGNESTVIRFTPTKSGMYPFYCDKKLLFFESHKEKGMEGTLEVRQ